MVRFAASWALLFPLLAGAQDAFREVHEARPLVPWAEGHVSSSEPRLGVPTFFWAGPGSQQPVRALTPEEAARRYLVAHAALYRTTPAHLATAQVTGLHDLHDGTALVVTFQQRVGGVRVFRDELKVVLDRHLALIALSGYLTPAVTPLGAFSLRAESALASAHQHLTGVSLEAATPLGVDEGGYTRWTLEGTRGARTRPVYFPLASGVVPAFYGELGHFSFVVSAVNGEVLFVHDLVVSHSFSVWADPATLVPFPGPQGVDTTPHPTGFANGLSPTPAPQQVVTLEHAGLSTSDPWLAPGATDTRGNNVRAYADLFFPDGYTTGSDVLGTTTAADTFGWLFDASTSVENPVQRRASVVQLFYVTNFLHDWFYDDGFDEAGRNAQALNFGRGGLANDALFAEAQDGDTPDNANMYTPADGAHPVMQLGVFTNLNGTPTRDAALDNGVVAHEWGHFISNRLIGDGNGLDQVQSIGMGEGWGDFHAALLMVEAADALVASNPNWQGTYSLSGWATTATDAQGHYWGFRRYPLSVDFTKNPLTFKHIADGEPLPASPSPSPLLAGYPNSETHNTGEVWAVALWECYVELLRDPRFTFEQARARMKRYLVAAYKATPLTPTFTEGRDALLAAATANDPIDAAHFWNAFARRGLGRGAVAPDRFDFTNVPVVESFRVGNPTLLGPIALDDSGLTCDRDGVLDADEQGMLTITVRNGDPAPIPGSRLTVSSGSPGVQFPSGTTWPIGALAGLARTTVAIPVRLANLGVVSDGTFEVSTQSPALGPDPVTTTVTFGLNFDVDALGGRVVDGCVNEPPTAAAGPDVEAEESVRIELVGSGNDPEGAPIDLLWTQTAGPPGVIRGSGFTTPEVSVDTQVTLELRVSDGRATSPPVEQRVLVKNVNRTPTARAPLSAEGVPGQRLTLAGSGYDSEGDPLTYEWTQVSGPPAQLEAARTASVRVLLPDVTGLDEVRVQLTVSDGNSASAPAVTAITVRGPPPVEVVPPEPKKPDGCGCSSGQEALLALGLLLLRRRRVCSAT
ncbi:MAG: M36 family metallopeptidase [Archangium sp.]|nr:M36 family metallopeptidase [Archangium sp.]